MPNSSMPQPPRDPPNWEEIAEYTMQQLARAEREKNIAELNARLTAARAAERLDVASKRIAELEKVAAESEARAAAAEARVAELEATISASNHIPVGERGPGLVVPDISPNPAWPGGIKAA